ncbi:MAG: cyclic nucleotide-binding domain-containing protein [Candidatus Hydrogenedentes bacterium]|nr:cyclic nucleotide-binding domain-containing protein [Candidatus Hydrogenedentota bacterium]MBI3118235.1 cyclic nucleotide-binding domain-containing protein [Candidatus Hydrogenedentota bacterium]
MVTNVGVKEMLLEHEFLRGLDPEWMEKLAEFTYTDSYYPNDYLFRAGEDADRCLLIRDGNVALELYDPRRGSVTLDTLSGNKVLGWSWLIPPCKWCFDARALALTRVLAINGPRLLQLMEEDHILGYAMLKRFAFLFADRLHAARLQLMDMYAPLR